MPKTAKKPTKKPAPPFGPTPSPGRKPTPVKNPKGDRPNFGSVKIPG